MRLVTRAQLLMLYDAWGAKSAAVPTKELQIVLSFPRTAMECREFNTIIVKKTSLTATYGGPLFSIDFRNL